MAKRSKFLRPTAYLVKDGAWPVGPFRADAPLTIDYLSAAVEIIRDELSSRGWTLSDLARQASVDKGTLSRALRGETWPNTMTMIAVEEALRVSVWPQNTPPSRRERPQ